MFYRYASGRAYGRALVLLAVCNPATASDFGVVGILDMPSARMQQDGALAASVSLQDTADFYALTYQALPWLEGSFRYSIFNPSKRDAVDDDLRDRSFELKAQLTREGAVAPAIAVGLRDMFGTGVWSGEYVVASKRFGALDVTIGAGWGRFADRDVIGNPLGVVDARFDERPAFEEGGQGQSLGNTFFRGPDIGVFGGFTYDIPRWRLRLLAEYSSDAYTREQGKGHFSDTSPYNYGVKWEPVPGVSFTASHQLGQDFGLTLTSVLDTRSQAPIKARAPFWSSTEPRSLTGAAADLDLSNWYSRLLYDVERSGVLLLSADVSEGGRVVWLEIENREYQYAADAIRRVLALAEVHLPVAVKTVNLILQTDEIVDATISYRRTSDSNLLMTATAEDRLTILPTPEARPNPRYETAFRVPNLSSSVGVSSRFQLMDPDDPLRYQVFASINSAADLGGGWFVRGSFAINLYNDFEDIDRDSDSVLPRVRSDVARYLKDGDSGIQALYLERRGMLNGEVSYRAYGGILEDMYSGVGAELLWRQPESRIALGFNANWVQQRDFNRGFGHRDFETTTAHASFYWATPFDGYDFAVHAGRYLARDVGATFELRRTFDNGWMIGAFATFTDVPFDDFGEGSFDKGLFFRIPFNSLVEGDSRGSYTTLIRLLQRDGGQRLENFGTTLWWESRPTRMDALVRTLDRMVPN